MVIGKRKIDRTKKSNIKCEHCKHRDIICGDYNSVQICENRESKKYGLSINYWNRCKHFEWDGSEEQP